MGHKSITTTQAYLHYAPSAGDARLVADAFATAAETADEEA
jgi:hypothetical protein